MKGKVFNSRKNGIHQVMANAGAFGVLTLHRGKYEIVIGKNGIIQLNGQIKKTVLHLINKLTNGKGILKEHIELLAEKYDTNIYLLPANENNIEERKAA